MTWSKSGTGSKLQELPIRCQLSKEVVKSFWFVHTHSCTRLGDTTPHTCAGGAKYGSIELQSYGSLDEAVPHDQGILEQRICFDPFCNDFRRVEVLWCRPDPVGGVQGKGNKPFHIYKLKPSHGAGFGYCVQWLFLLEWIVCEIIIHILDWSINCIQAQSKNISLSIYAVVKFVTRVVCTSNWTISKLESGIANGISVGLVLYFSTFELQ